MFVIVRRDFEYGLTFKHLSYRQVVKIPAGSGPVGIIAFNRLKTILARLASILKKTSEPLKVVCSAEGHHSESIRNRERTICMAGLFYTVDLSRDERMARNPRLVDKFLVELCREHCPDNWHETDRESLAIAMALKALEHRYSPEVAGGIIGHKEATRYKEIIPTNLGEEHFSLSCGCRAWKI